MPRRHQLQKLLQTPGIWKAAAMDRQQRPILPTGFAELDHALAGGWPVGALIELLSESCGVGEFRLLLPALLALDDKRRILLVAPPHIPYAPAFKRYGLDVSRLLIVRCGQDDDALWAVEQALRSGVCAAVLAWVAAADGRALRRLQLAAENSDTWSLLLRPARYSKQRSPAALRMMLKPGIRADIQIQILKYRGGRPQGFCVDIGSE